MSFWDKPKQLFKAKQPNLSEYLGKNVKIREVIQLEGKPAVLSDKNVIIVKIVGNKFKPTFYEINDEYLIGMLRFHAQMTGDKSITEQQFLDFENMDVEAEVLPRGEKKDEQAKPELEN